MAVINMKDTVLMILSKPVLQKTSYNSNRNLQDPGNLGTIVRMAEGAGVTGIVISSNALIYIIQRRYVQLWGQYTEFRLFMLLIL